MRFSQSRGFGFGFFIVISEEAIKLFEFVATLALSALRILLLLLVTGRIVVITFIATEEIELSAVGLPFATTEVLMSEIIQLPLLGTLAFTKLSKDFFQVVHDLVYKAWTWV